MSEIIAAQTKTYIVGIDRIVRDYYKVDATDGDAARKTLAAFAENGVNADGAENVDFYETDDSDPGLHFLPESIGAAEEYEVAS